MMYRDYMRVRICGSWKALMRTNLSRSQTVSESRVIITDKTKGLTQRHEGHLESIDCLSISLYNVFRENVMKVSM